MPTVMPFRWIRTAGLALPALLAASAFAAGEPGAKPKPAGPAVKLITSFEGKKNPFNGGTVVAEHATDGTQALRIDRGGITMEGAQDWSGYDYLKADVFTESKEPLTLYVEVRDKKTDGYWTRVNYSTTVPPGASTLTIPTALYVGEKARPGRMLLTNAITLLHISIGDKPGAPLFLDNLRLERDTTTAGVLFDGLLAFDLGPAGSPVMDGFTPLDQNRKYTKENGYGWKNAQIWRGHDALQPDPLYRDFLCIDRGGLAIDLPNGKYHVFVNMDSPSGFWGEVARYRKRALIVQGKRYEDTMDLESFKKHYFRHWNVEDLPADNTFDKYQIPYFKEKLVEAEVKDGQLNIAFDGGGELWACSVSAIVVYPDSKAEEGKRFLEFVKARRRFHFDNAFKRVLPPAPSGNPFKPTDKTAEWDLGFIVFHRDLMQDVQVNDRPAAGERLSLDTSAFAGEHAPVTVSAYPLRDLGAMTAAMSDLKGPGGAVIPASAVEVGFVQYKITRVASDGSTYTIAPRYVMPGNSAPAVKEVPRTFWFTVKVPANAAAGEYKGHVSLSAGGGSVVPFRLTVRPGRLDEVDIPVGPFGHTIDLPWFADEAAEFNRGVTARGLEKLREYGFTTATGLPAVTYHGFKDGKPQLDFSRGDAQMKLFKEKGFKMAVVTYTGFGGLNTYFRDEAAMKAAGFTEYSAFLKAVFGAVQKHADEAGWLPVYWNIGDEPVDKDVLRAAANAAEYRKAFPQGPPWFSLPSSFTGSKADDPHFRLAKELHAVAWNLHDAAGVKLQHDAGSDWGFYNGGNRWTFGIYMYKAAKQYGMKFRVSWHWNVVAGDPYYALDCREDDYCWCNTAPDGRLIPTIHFEQLREGLGDYRRLLTLARLAKEKAGTPAAKEADAVIAEILGGFELGQRDPKDPGIYSRTRAKLDEAIGKLR